MLAHCALLLSLLPLCAAQGQAVLPAVAKSELPVLLISGALPVFGQGGRVRAAAPTAAQDPTLDIAGTCQTRLYLQRSSFAGPKPQ